MDIRFALLFPTQSPLLLVDSPVPRPAQTEVARLLLQSKRTATQVCFVEVSDCARARLQLAGNAFSGNGTMALAARLALSDGLASGQDVELLLEVSGAEGVLPCRVSAGAGACRVAAAMPRPDRIAQVPVGGVSLPVVFFPGIAHCIVPAGALEPARAEALIAPLCRRLGAPACGLLLLDEAKLSCTPLLYAAQTGLSRWVPASASGSAAVGAWLSHRDGANRALSLRQPGGVVDVSVRWKGRVSTLAVAGSVRQGGWETLTIPI